MFSAPKLIACTIATSLLCVSSASVSAIDLITISGQSERLAGDVEKVTKTAVTIKTRKGSQEVAANTIEFIEWDGQPARLVGALGQERNGRYKEALETLKEVREKLPSTATNLIDDVEFFQARIQGKIGLSDETQLQASIDQLKDFLSGNLNYYRYFEGQELLGRLYRTQKSYLEAETTYRSLEKSPFEGWQIAAKDGLARIALAQNQLNEALSQFNAVLGMKASTDQSKERQLSAKLGKVACLQKQNNHQEARKLLEQLLSATKPNQTSLQAETYLRRADSFLAEGKTQQALIDYLMVDVVFAGEAEYRAEALYQLTQLWPGVGHPERAQDAAADLQSNFPSSEWTQKLTSP